MGEKMFGLYNLYSNSFDTHYEQNTEGQDGLSICAYKNKNDADFYLYFKHQYETEYYEIRKIPQDVQLWKPFKGR